MTLDADTRHQLDSVFYDKVVSKYYKNVGQQPPDKDQWLRRDRQYKLTQAQNFKPNPLVNWVSYEEKAPDKQPPEMTSGQRAKYYSAKIVDSALKYVDTEMKVESKLDEFWTHAFKGHSQDARLDVEKKGFTTATKPLHDKLNQYFESVEPQVQHDLRTKIFGAAAGFIPDLALFKGVGEGLKPFIGELEAGKISSDSLITKAGGITKLLQSTPYGRTAYRLMEGALQGFTVDMAQGDDVHKAISDAPSWGIFNAALPVAGKVISAPFKASMKLYSEMATHTGAEFVIQSMANTTKRLEQTNPEPIKDELLKKLDLSHLGTTNDVADKKFGKLYTFLTPDQKKTVTAQVRGILNESFNNPVAHAETATVLETNKQVMEQAASDPIFAKQAQRMQAATEKVTGSKVITGPAKEAKKQAEILSDKVVPGAASSESPEFLNNLLAKYEANIGFENPKHKLLAMWANKDEYPPQIAQRVQEEMDEMYRGLSHKQVQARLKFLQTHIAKLDATWEINPQGDKKRVFRSTSLTHQGKTEWQRELDELYNSTFGEK